MKLPMNVLASAIGLALGLPLSPTHASMGGAWTPALWFLANEQGIWLDPSDLTDAKQAFRKNLTAYTESLGVAGSTATYTPNVTYQQNARLAPNGQMAMDKIIATTTNGPHGYGPIGYYASPGEIYTMSVYVAYGGLQYVSLKPDNNWNPVAVFDLVNGVVVSQSPSVTNVSIEALPDGVFRISVSGVPAAGEARYGFLALQDGPVYANWAGNGTDGVYAWGFQIEKGNAPTAYQPVLGTYETLFLSQYPNHTMFQNSAGTIPVTAVEQPVGLVLDKRLGLVRGPELVTGDNANFAAGVGDWVGYSSATIAAVSGALRVTQNASNGRAAISITGAVIGKTYELTGDVRKISGSVDPFLCFSLWGDGNSAYAPGNTTNSASFVRLKHIHTAGSTTLIISAGQNGGGDGVFEYDNISVRELPGNHASQTTTAQKPVLSARKNWLAYTEQFANAAWLKSNLTNVIDGQADPFGGYTAAKLVANSVAGRHAVYMATVIPLTADSIATVYAKAAGVGGIEVGMGNSTYQGIYVDLTTGAITDASAAYTATSTSVGDGWWKITISGSRTADTSNLWFGCSSSNNAFFSGNGVDGILICRPQWEYGLTSTPYQRVTTNTDYDTVGFPHYLKFDGVDDYLVTGNIDFTATDKMTVIAGVRKLSDAATNLVVELSTNSNDNAGSFFIATNDGNKEWSTSSRGNAAAANGQSAFDGTVAPDTAVITATHDISGDLSRLRRNGVYGANGTADKGTGNFGNHSTYIGRRGGTSLPFNGYLYSLTVRGAATDAAGITAGETYTAGKTGITL